MVFVRVFYTPLQSLFDLTIRSGNIVLGSVTIGMLAQPIFTLTLPHTVAVIIGFGIMCIVFEFIALGN